MSVAKPNDSASSRAAPDPVTTAAIVASGIIAGYAAVILLAFTSHIWLLDGRGEPVPFDFVAFWSAGRLVLTGSPLVVFNPASQHAAEVATIGHAFRGTLGWSYPPLFLFVAVLLACLPYILSFFVWMSATVLAYAGVVAAIAKRRSAWILALAPPWVLLGILNGQNGFLSAAIAGAALLTLKRRPALSGMILGLLSFKPQLAILFPLAIAAGGYWRAFFWACIGTALWTAISCAVFGIGTIPAFLVGLSSAAHTHLASGGVAPQNLQSIYGLSRWFGAPETLAMAVQAGFSVVVMILIAIFWRSRSPFPLKAAGIAAAMPLVTPYIYVSDLVILSMAVSFLFREKPFDKWECGALAFAMAAVFAFIFQAYPAGLFASLAVGAIVWRRHLATVPASGIGVDRALSAAAS